MRIRILACLVLIALVLAVPAHAQESSDVRSDGMKKVLLAFADSDAADDAARDDEYQVAINSLMKTCPFRFKSVLLPDSTALEAAAQSGDYSVMLVVGMPECDVALSSPAELLAGGCGKLGYYMSRSDTTIPIPMVVTTPWCPNCSSGSAFQHTGAVGQILPTVGEFEYYSSQRGVAYIVGDDSILVNYIGATTSLYFPLIDTTQTYVKNLIRMDYPNQFSYVPTLAWASRKTNGNEVYVIPYCAVAAQWPTIVDVVSSFVDVQAVDVSVSIDGFTYDTDTTGTADGFDSLVDQIAEDQIKITFDMIPWGSNTIFPDVWRDIERSFDEDIHNFILNTLRSPNDTDLVGYQYSIGSRAQRRDLIELAFDSLFAPAGKVQEYLSVADIDTTDLMPFYGYLSTSDSTYLAHDVLLDFAMKGVTTVVTRGTQYGMIANLDERRPISVASRLFLDETYQIDAILTGQYSPDMYPTDEEDSIPDYDRAGDAGELFYRWCCGRINAGELGAVDTYTGDERSQDRILVHAAYQPGLTFQFFNCEERSGDVFTQPGDFGLSNLEWAVQTVNDVVSLHNQVAADIKAWSNHTTVDRAPFRYCFVSEARWGRRTGMRLPNSHVTRR